MNWKECKHFQPKIGKTVLVVDMDDLAPIFGLGSFHGDDCWCSYDANVATPTHWCYIEFPKEDKDKLKSNPILDDECQTWCSTDVIPI